MNEKSWELYSQILSQEDISLSYSEYAPTAYFDMKSRQVVIPVFDFLDEDTTQLLVSHEVGHAKHSSYTEEEFSEYTNKYGDLFNVIEDAHIENRMKAEFRGLKTIFNAGYKTLHTENFFEVKDVEDFSSLPLLSRLNLFYKIGHLVSIPFEGVENDFAVRMKLLSSTDDVISLCEEIYNYLQENKHSQNEEKQQSEEDSQDDNCCGNEEQESFKENQSSSDKEQSSDKISSDISSQLKDDTYRAVQNNLSKYGEQHIIKEKNKLSSLNLSSNDAKNNILDYTQFYESIRKEPFYKSKASKDYTKQVKDLAKSADLIFKQRKKAEELKESRNKQTGRLDAKKLSKYKISTNLFSHIKVMKEGKNHGIVILVDYSGSMASYLKDTLIQACVLGEFCRMNDIPFVILAFGISCHNNYNFNNVMMLGNNTAFDISALMFLSKGRSISFSHKKKDINLYGGMTPTVDALLVATYYIKAFKEIGVDKTALYLITDGYHTTEHFKENNWRSFEHNVNSLIVDNTLLKVKKYVTPKSVHDDWVIELLCRNLKNKYDTFISISHIGNFYKISFCFSPELCSVFPKLNPMRHYFRGDYADNYIFLWKHAMYFEQIGTIPCEPKDGIVSYNFKNNPFIDHFQLLDQQQETHQKDLTTTLKWYKRMKLFVNAFIEQFS